jgi:hypothetical protein
MFLQIMLKRLCLSHRCETVRSATSQKSSRLFCQRGRRSTPLSELMIESFEPAACAKSSRVVAAAIMIGRGVPSLSAAGGIKFDLRRFVRFSRTQKGSAPQFPINLRPSDPSLD